MELATSAGDGDPALPLIAERDQDQHDDPNEVRHDRYGNDRRQKNETANHRGWN